MKTVAVSLNRQLEQVIREALLSDSLTQEQKNCLAEDIEKSYVSVRSLSLVQRILADNQKSYSHLLKGSKLLFPKFMEKFSSKESISAEVKQRRKFLKQKDEEREYNRMVHGLNGLQDTDTGLGKSIATTQTQLSILLNVIVATLTAYGIGYYFAAYFTMNSNHRMVGGLGTSIVVMIMEMILYVIRATQMNT